ncbi:helix-turn-helix protein [Actinomycetospora succinea]|uniref:Helix-turn-helix protein n=1 Tax=Actinomycetospora succinea TaxID=663603 RepID=A0A4R6VE84_9PSEU|nr:metalloregulator ArsR/SmtB family transcription factor [Actinomycetospora succinea]TDQ58740.1 helix-turn-helix protein [Actinomycetospora succinea]
MDPKEDLAFDALSDRVRRRILSVLGEEGELPVNALAERVGTVGRTTVSSHLRLLRTSGIVRERREGRNRYYSLDTEGAVREAFTYLQSILRQAVDEIDDSPPAPAAVDPDRERGTG